MKTCLFGLIALIIFVAGCAAPPVVSPVKPVYGTTNPTARQKADARVKKFASVTELLPEKEGKKYLVSYMEYAGDDLEKDFASLGQDKTIRDKWWPITDPCQKPLPGTAKGEQWKPIEMLMHIP